MSRGWETGSTRAWRKYRSEILFRDGGLCQLQLPGCLVYADQVHHIDGVTTSKTPPDPTRCQAACGPCNRTIGDPTRTNPAPHPPTTNWDTP